MHQAVVVLHVHMHVPQTRQQRFVAGIDDFNIRRKRHRAIVAHGLDQFTAHDHRLRRLHALGCRVEQVGVDDRDSAARLACERARCNRIAPARCELLRFNQLSLHRFKAATYHHLPGAAAGEQAALGIQPDRFRREAKTGDLERRDTKRPTAGRDRARHTGTDAGVAFRQQCYGLGLRQQQRTRQRGDIGRNGLNREIKAGARRGATGGGFIAPGQQRSGKRDLLAHRHLEVAQTAQLHADRQTGLVDLERLGQRRSASAIVVVVTRGDGATTVGPLPQPAARPTRHQDRIFERITGARRRAFRRGGGAVDRGQDSRCGPNPTRFRCFDRASALRATGGERETEKRERSHAAGQTSDGWL